MEAQFLHYENAQLSVCPRDVSAAGVFYQWFGVLPQVARYEHREVPMTPTQAMICEYLRRNAGRLVSAYELRDAVAPDGGIENMRVQIFKLRQAGHRCIESVQGNGGGYRWAGDGAWR